MTILEQLVAEIQAKDAAYKHTTPSGVPSGSNYTGPDGLFGVAGLERDVISTRVQPRGIAGALPALGTEVANPLFAYLTGFQDVTGTNPEGVCDDPQTAGAGKSCIQTAQFGRYEFQTRELELNSIGQIMNRGEFTDLRIANDPLLFGGLTVPASTNPDATTLLRREVLMRFMEVGIAFQNKLARQIYNGNPANNTAGYREFPGLDILINTGKIDAITGTSCPSLDSDIRDFNYALIEDQDIVETLIYQFRDLRHIADSTGLSPVQWVIAMRRELFYELTRLWPCSYITYGCTFRDNSGNTVLNVDATDQTRMRDEMRNGSYLLIDGERVQVLLDDGITENSNTTDANVPNASFASDIYILPLTIMGGMPVTYWEYLNYSASIMQGVVDGRLGNHYWTDGGRFLWHVKPPRNWCVQWLSKIEPRLVLRTPHLAGRLQNVRYAPLSHSREPFNDDPYFVNGGVTSGRPGPSLTAEWGQVTN